MRCFAPLLILSLGGCVYYNAMWSANRYAKEAQRLEARGQNAEARSQWAQAAVKAESVVVRHPRSRWADDALVLQTEALARSGSCAQAAVAITRARATVHETSLRERAGLAAAECALAAGRPVHADEALAEALASKDAGRRSRAEYLAGQAATLRLDYDAAVEHFRRSRDPRAVPDRARALLAAGRDSEATPLIDTLATTRLSSTVRAELFETLGRVAGAPAASTALDRHLLRARVPFAEQVQLLIADGDRRLAAGDYDAAAERYHRAADVASPASTEAGTARVREQRVTIARARQRGDLDPVIADLTHLIRPEEGGGGGSAAQSLLDLVTRVSAPEPTPGARFRAAELARDSLNAPALAGQLFLDAAAADSASLFTPKALVAALALLPDRRDSIATLLDARYRGSPYTRAFHGEPSVAYVAAEDSLARELGVQIAEAPHPVQLLLEAPRTGPRGPALDEPSDRRDASARPTRPRATDRATPTRERPGQPDRP